MSIVSKDPWTPITAEQWDALRKRWPNGQRLAWAWRLAPNVEVLAQLIAGEYVDPRQLNQDALAWARKQKLVRLDATVADVVGVAA